MHQVGAIPTGGPTAIRAHDRAATALVARYRGEFIHALRGVPDRWHVYRVNPDRARPYVG
jgi:hypothetical protein